ncbi:hypothetical protein L208DRAFT_1296697 [Tricholoma matsutake]|nr:hypothetical protein L208DRAFT_1296697 [Tricholoma matsutake 945]
MVKDSTKLLEAQERELLVASTSNAGIIDPPPPFTHDSPGPQLLIDDLPPSASGLDGLPGELQLPPEFSTYHADYFEVGNGDIVSHDSHLNTDGEALYRFLLAQADNSPSLQLHCRGTHSEHRTRWITEHNSRGHHESRRETYTETVTDFDFCIEVGPGSTVRPTHWSVADSEPAYRGLMVREVEEPTGKRLAKQAEKKAHGRWSEERKARGLPPWVTSMDGSTDGMSDDARPLRSSKTLRQWADEYCASPKYLKEFVYKKATYGWNLQKLESAVRASINTSRYWGHVEVQFTTRGSNVYIRPDNRLSTMLSNKWLKFLSILLLIFPFIWLFKRYNSRGGGRWEVCGGAYALKRWELVDRTQAVPTRFISSPRIIQTPQGAAKLIGVREGEWLMRWEGTIIRAVLGNYQSSTPIFAVDPDLDGL